MTSIKIFSGLLFLFLFPSLIYSQTEKAPLYIYDVEKRIEQIGIQLTEPELPPGINILFVRQVGNLVYLSGNGPLTDKGIEFAGKVGSDLSVDEGYKAARLTAINQLSVLKSYLGDLNRVVQIVKVLGMVNAGPEFTDHPAVINGFSDLMVEVFGDRGRHARSAVGMASLPWNIACEVEMIVEVSD